MKKIKEILIHWLGGYTEEEICKSYRNGYYTGWDINTRGIKRFADSLYGLNAEDWCEKMYEFIEEEYDANKDCKIDV